MRRILWFRRDLRVEDAPLLTLEGEVLPIFIFDTNILHALSPDDRRVAQIFVQVMALKTALRLRGLDLKIYYGTPKAVFKTLQGFDAVAASGDYEGYARARDVEISHLLPFEYLHDTYIFTPQEAQKPDGSPYAVFTPFYNKAKTLFGAHHLRFYTPKKQTLVPCDYETLSVVGEGILERRPLRLDSIGFRAPLPEAIDVAALFAHLEAILPHYENARDMPAQNGTSHLSVALRLGVVSIRAVLRFLATQKKRDVKTEPFFRQLIFRDFYAYALYHTPRIEEANYKYRFNGVENASFFESFCTAQTGVPLVDAGVRELLATGMMHNRVRMVCASFFTKDLLLPWQWGEAFFAKHLLDYDKASNVLSWQWSAGTGVDPQPYFRIFNPYAQAKKFDLLARYIKTHLPELTHLEPKQLHDEDYLHTHDIAGYPKPIVEHKVAAKSALEAFKKYVL